MKAVILCGGLGTRLREETEYRPKPLVEIGGKPILWHIMKIYSSYGIRDFVLCLGYKGYMIKEYFLNYRSINSDLTINAGEKDNIVFHNNSDINGWRFTLVDTGIETMTGSRIKRVEPFIDEETFMVTYGDGVADIAIDKLLAFHHAHKRIATITSVRPSSRFGEILAKGKMVKSFVEKPSASKGWINGGFFVFHRRIFDLIKAKKDDSALEGDVMENLVRKGELATYLHKGYWQCLDTSRDLDALKKEWKSKHPKWKIWGNK